MGKKTYKLELHHIERAEIRRGWVRIEEATRDGIESGSLVVLRLPKGKVKRIVLGTPPEGYLNIKNPTGMIFLDEPTREKLGLRGTSCLGKTKEFTITRPGWFRKWFWHAPLFYWNHPDFPVNFASKMAIISILMGAIALFVSLAPDPITIYNSLLGIWQTLQTLPLVIISAICDSA